WTCATEELVGDAKVRISRAKRYDCARYSSDDVPGGQHRSRVESVTEEAIRQTRGGTKPPPPGWIKACYEFPFSFVGRGPAAQHSVATRNVEHIASPSERANSRK